MSSLCILLTSALKVSKCRRISRLIRLCLIYRSWFVPWFPALLVLLHPVLFTLLLPAFPALLLPVLFALQLPVLFTHVVLLVFVTFAFSTSRYRYPFIYPGTP